VIPNSCRPLDKLQNPFNQTRTDHLPSGGKRSVFTATKSLFPVRCYQLVLCGAHHRLTTRSVFAISIGCYSISVGFLSDSTEFDQHLAVRSAMAASHLWHSQFVGYPTATPTRTYLTQPLGSSVLLTTWVLASPCLNRPFPHSSMSAHPFRHMPPAYRR